MTVHFAAARTPSGSVVARILAPRGYAPAANDNGLGAGGGRPMLDAALRHYRENGASAARDAAIEARRARRRGDAQAYRWWASICYTLDRRCADALSGEADAPKATG